MGIWNESSHSLSYSRSIDVPVLEKTPSIVSFEYMLKAPLSLNGMQVVH